MALTVKQRPTKGIYSSDASFSNDVYLFDGVNDSIQINDLKVKSDDLTISFFCKLSDVVNRQLFLWDSGANNLALWDNGGLFLSDAVNGTVVAPSLSVDTITNVTIVIKGTSSLTYINGVQQATIATVEPIDLTNTTTDFNVGSGFVSNMEGQIDQLVIFKRALTFDEIKQLYNNGEPQNIDWIRTQKQLLILAYLRNGVEIYNNAYNVTLSGGISTISQSDKLFFEDPIFTSSWNAIGGDLPVRYTLKSDLFPVNSVDANLSVSSVSTYFGASQFTTGTPHGYLVGDYVTHSGFTIGAYNGLHKITAVVSSTIYVLEIAFAGNDTGNSLKYYNNYQAVIRVFAGLPDAHPLSSYKPIAEIGDLSITPNSSNEVDVDLTTFVKSKISTKNNVNSGLMPVDIDNFTGFYVEFAESYDEATINGIISTQTPFVKDEFLACVTGQELFNDFSFASGLGFWSTNGYSGNVPWAGGSGFVSANYTTEIFSVTRTLYQAVQLNKGTTYVFNIIKSIGDDVEIRLLVSEDSAAGPNTRTTSVFSSTDNNITFTFTADKDYLSAGLSASFNVSKPNGSSVQLESFSVQASDCTPILWGSNSVQQFQYHLGGNMGDYVAANDGKLCSFMTFFNTPKFFDGYPFTLSCIISSEAINGSYLGDNVFYRMTFNTSNGLSIVADKTINLLGDGLYRLGEENNVNLIQVVKDFLSSYTINTIDFQLLSVPDNLFIDGDFGTFDNISNPAGLPPSDWNLTLTPNSGNNIYSPSIIYSNSPDVVKKGNGASVININADDVTLLSGESVIITFNSSVSLLANSDYTIKYWFKTLFASHDPRLDDKIDIIIRPTGYSLNQITYSNTLFRDNEEYKQAIVNFNTGNNTTFTFELVINLLEPILGTGNTGGSFFLDEIELLGPVQELSEKKKINVNNDCYSQGIYLQWLNKLGGYDSWLFTTEKDYTADINEKHLIKRDILQNWDSEFIDGDTQYDFTALTSRDKVVVRSQLLTEEEYDAIVQIKDSISVQEVREDGSIITVEVDKRNFPIKQDRQKLYEIEFTIKYPDNFIQNQ